MLPRALHQLSEPSILVPVPEILDTITKLLSGDVIYHGGATALITLIISLILVFGLPEDTKRVTDRVLDNPIEVFVWGLLTILISFFGIFFLLFVGAALIAIPLLIVLAIILAVTGVFGYLTVGRVIAEDRLAIIAIAIVSAVFAAGIPYAGFVFGFVVSTLGVGATVLDVQSEYHYTAMDDLAGPGTIKGSIGISTERGELRTFEIVLSYWDYSTWLSIIQICHDSSGEKGWDVTVAGVQMERFRNGRVAETISITDPSDVQHGYESATTYLTGEFNEIIRDFESEHSIDETLSDHELDTARDTFTDLVDDVDAYLNDWTSNDYSL